MYCMYGLISVAPTNELGLSKFDLAMGGQPDVVALRTKTRAAADVYLKQHDAELKAVCQGPYELTVDYSLSRKIRSLDYVSSFYYYCWDIYLPYLLKAQSGNTYTVVVQVSDATKGNKHDPDKFRVIRTMVIDVNSSVTKEFE